MFNIIDNVATKAVKSYLEDKGIKMQLVEPHNHRSNAAERAIQTFRNHAIAGLCTCDEDFPCVLFLLDDFAPQDRRKIFVARAEPCNCVVLEGLDGPLCCIGAVVMWFDELHLDVFVFKVSFYCFCYNIINDVETGLKFRFF